MARIFLIWLLAITGLEKARGASLNSSSPGCPLNFAYLVTLPWDQSACKTSNQTSCCQTLLLVFAVGLSVRLKTNGNFRLPDAPTSAACLSAYQSYLAPFSLPPGIVSSCFPDPNRFVISPNSCAGILTATDMAKKLGNNSEYNRVCSSNVTAPEACLACQAAALDASARLARLAGNESQSTDCFYLLCTYAAGVVSMFGPEDPPTLTCMLGLPLDTARVNPGGTSRKISLGLVVGLACAGVGLAAITSVATGAYYRWAKPAPGREPAGRPNTGAVWFKLSELQQATRRFSDKNLIGKGSCGVVYRGTLEDGSVVAVKKIVESSVQRDEDFRNEVDIISNLRHRNLVPLRGCCIDEKSDDEERTRYLVYAYMDNGNLDDQLFGQRGLPLTWPQRKNVILDVAKGLEYLHYGVKPAIYHRDVKPTNILLDGEMRASVADFGLAKQVNVGESNLTTRVAGTHGYLAPEYALYGQLTDKSDVYSFGVVVLEVMCGRRALDTAASAEAVLITDWAWALVKEGRGEAALDPVLLKNEEGQAGNPIEIMKRYVMVGIHCAHVMVALRPTIRDALSMLEGDVEVPPLPDRPLPIGPGYNLSGEAGILGFSSTTSDAPSMEAGEMLR